MWIACVIILVLLTILSTLFTKDSPPISVLPPVANVKGRCVPVIVRAHGPLAFQELSLNSFVAYKFLKQLVHARAEFFHDISKHLPSLAVGWLKTCQRKLWRIDTLTFDLGRIIRVVLRVRMGMVTAFVFFIRRRKRVNSRLMNVEWMSCTCIWKNTIHTPAKIEERTLRCMFKIFYEMRKMYGCGCGCGWWRHCVFWHV